jgi:LysM repeat protein
MGSVRHTAAWLAALGLAWAGAVGCASPTPSERRAPVMHVVAPGETIYAIARHYGVSVDAIVMANQITDFSAIGSARLVIPEPSAPSRQSSLASDSIPIAIGICDRAPVRRISSSNGRSTATSRPATAGAESAATRHRSHRQAGHAVLAEVSRVIGSGWRGDYGRVVVVNALLLHALRPQPRGPRQGAFVGRAT